MPRYINVYQVSRTGMVRLSWHHGFGGVSQLEEDLAPFSSIALKLPTVVQDRSWGRLPTILASDDFSAAPSGGEDARGWPFLALWCHLDETAPAGYTTRGGIPLSPPATTTGAARVLPYFPIWRGLCLNTLIYAAGWFVIILLFRHVRARVRLRRGHCSRCNYDLGHGHGPCPECGHHRKPRALAPVESPSP